jgi:hypothetical protein
MTTRRDALTAASAALLAGALARAPRAAAQDPTPRALLSSLLLAEQLGEVVYGELARRPAFGRRMREVFAGMGEGGRERAAALVPAVRRLGTKPSRRPEAAAVPGLAAAGRSRGAGLRFAMGYEHTTLGGWYETQSRLRGAELLRLGASVMAAHAQQLTVLRRAAGEDPVPRAFETGTVTG